MISPFPGCPTASDGMRPAAALGLGDPLTAPEAAGDGGGGATSRIDAQAAAFERLTERIAATQLERRLIGLTSEEAAALTEQYELEQLELELLTAAKEAGNAVTAAEVAQAQTLIDRLGDVTAARRAEEAATREQAEAAREAEAAERELASAISSVGDEMVRVIDQGGGVLDILQAIADQILRMPQLEEAISSGGSSGGILGSLVQGITGLLGGGGGGVTTLANNPFQGASASLFTPSGGVALPSFNHGADFRVGGRAGIDQNLVSFMATKNERVEITPAGEVGERRGDINMPITIYANDARDVREAAGSVARRAAAAARRGSGYL